jgi:DNA-binding transcriptional LysR family regulator
MVEVNDRFDVVVHIGQLRSSNMVAHIIAPNRRYVCASPDFIERYGSPEHPEDLISLPCIALRENNEDVTRWSFSRTGNTLNVRIRPALSCNDGSTIRKWACDGYGIIMRSEWDVAESLANGSLVRLLPRLGAARRRYCRTHAPTRRITCQDDKLPSISSSSFPSAPKLAGKIKLSWTDPEP